MYSNLLYLTVIHSCAENSGNNDGQFWEGEIFLHVSRVSLRLTGLYWSVDHSSRFPFTGRSLCHKLIVSTNLCFRETKQFSFKPDPSCTNRLSIWIRENVNRRLQSCLSPSRPFPLLESLFTHWPMKSQMRLTNQTKVSLVVSNMNTEERCKITFLYSTRKNIYKSG